MFSSNSRNYIRNKVRKFLNSLFDISFNLLYIYIYVCVCVYVKVKKKGIFKIFINLKTNEKPMLITKIIVLKYLMRSS